MRKLGGKQSENSGNTRWLLLAWLQLLFSRKTVGNGARRSVRSRVTQGTMGSTQTEAKRVREELHSPFTQLQEVTRANCPVIDSGEAGLGHKGCVCERKSHWRRERKAAADRAKRQLEQSPFAAELHGRAPWDHGRLLGMERLHLAWPRWHGAEDGRCKQG